MRVVVDTNILISALLIEASLPARLLLLWRGRKIRLVTSTAQLDEFARVSRYPKLRERLSPARAGRLMNDLRELAELLERLPPVSRCGDPNDDYLLAMVEASGADALITGDKADLLALERHSGSPIMTIRTFFERSGSAS